jgi:hypothetical protein
MEMGYRRLQIIEAGGNPDGTYEIKHHFDGFTLDVEERDAEAVRKALRREDLPFRQEEVPSPSSE